MTKKGHIPWNKGKKCPQLAGKNCYLWKGGQIKRNCFICGKEFFVKPSTIKNGDGKFCSTFCYHKSWKGKKHSQLAKEKMRKIRKGLHLGKKHPNWKGGKQRHSQGYIFIYQPNHPFATKRKLIAEHRLIVEKQIGRYLLPKEKVHHLGNKDDNRPQMLMAFVHDNAHHRFEQGYKVKVNEIVFDGRKL